MTVVIRGTLHFEKCLPDSVHGSIRATTTRMALRDSLDNNRNVHQFAASYLTELKSLISQLESGRILHLKEQPIFEWQIDNKAYFSSNWRWEHVMVLYAIAQQHQKDGIQLSVEQDFKAAKKSFLEAAKICTEIKKGPVAKWSFKDMNVKYSYSDFWDCEQKLNESYALLMTSQFAIKEEKLTLLPIIGKKLYKSVETCFHQSQEAQHIHDLALLMVAYTHAIDLWNKSNHGDSLAMTRWSEIQKPQMGGCDTLYQWFTDTEELFQSYHRENENVYFCKVSDTIPDIGEILTEKKT